MMPHVGRCNRETSSARKICLMSDNFNFCCDVSALQNIEGTVETYNKKHYHKQKYGVVKDSLESVIFLENLLKYILHFSNWSQCGCSG